MTSLVSTKVLFLFVLAPLLTTGQFACSSDNDGTTGGEGGASTGVPLQCSNSDGLQIISLAAGSGHTCAVTSNGGVRCWGMNQLGQLGDGTTNDRWTPPMSDVLTGVKAIAAAAGSTCALMDAGGVRCWGENNYGQLGDGTSTYRSTPPSTDVLTGVRAIAAGGNHTCALLDTGGVRCWGYNTFGQLGDGTTTNRSTPPTTDVLTGVRAIAAGDNHTCALLDTGGVRCWGENSFGQLGDNSEASCTDSFYLGHGMVQSASVPCHLSPPTVDTLTGVRAIAAGGRHTCALMETGGARCWGANYDGQLGQSSANTCSRADSTEIGGVAFTKTGPCTLIPPASDVLTGVQDIAVGYDHTCALMSEGGVRCWGYNIYGQLGDGTTTDISIPPTSDVLTGVQAIALGIDHTCALMQTGGVRCWGSNPHGQLGDSTSREGREIPPTSDIFAGVQAIATGVVHSCALMDTGGVRCWGANYDGQIGDGTPPSAWTEPNRSTLPASDVVAGAKAVATGDGYTCALMQTGGVRCWGSNLYGQLGDGTTTNTSTPPTSDVLTGVKTIATGRAHTCALMDAGGVRCWGSDLYGQLGDDSATDKCALWSNGDSTPCRLAPPTGDVLMGVQAIAAGLFHTCALMDTGGVRCWGYNDGGQLGEGTTTNSSTPPTGDVLTGVQAIAAGDEYTCALMDAGGVRCWGDNSVGQLGDDSATDQCVLWSGAGSTPCRLAPPTGDVLMGVKAVATGGAHTCTLMDTGGVRCWGDNYYGQLGDGTTNNRLTPPTSDVLTDVVAIAAGTVHTCTLMSSGGVRCWGFNEDSELGEVTMLRTTPVHAVGTCE